MIKGWKTAGYPEFQIHYPFHISAKKSTPNLAENHWTLCGHSSSLDDLHLSGIWYDLSFKIGTCANSEMELCTQNVDIILILIVNTIEKKHMSALNE